MSQVIGVPKVTYAVRDQTISQWAWFWIEGLGGTLEMAGSDEFGNQHYEILMGNFATDLVSAAAGTRSSKTKANANARNIAQVIHSFEIKENMPRVFDKSQVSSAIIDNRQVDQSTLIQQFLSFLTRHGSAQHISY